MYKHLMRSKYLIMTREENIFHLFRVLLYALNVYIVLNDIIVYVSNLFSTLIFCKARPCEFVKLTFDIKFNLHSF